VAVGLRPCSGAIILLVFALSQGLFWAGAVSTFVMGLGTAVTVAAIAMAAVGAKAFVKRFATSEISFGGVLVRGMEVGAAGLILAFGLLLLAGYMATERLTLF
jgi:nickel/cobalt exporter